MPTPSARSRSRSGTDASKFDPDSPLPRYSRNQPEQERARERAIALARAREPQPLRQLAQRARRLCGASRWSARPRTIADEMQQWLETDAADGFIHRHVPPILPGGLDDFCFKLSCPNLPAGAGSSGASTRGTTLREKSGAWPRPKNRFF